MAKQKTSTPLRIGIVGAGIGQAHIRGYKQVPEVEIAAICDLNEERARHVAHDNELAQAQIFADHRAMLDQVELDAVSVCVPNVAHRPIAVDCLNAGKHVLCEKPLAINAREAQKIADAASKNKLKCMVAQVNRFRADSIFLKQCIQNGDLGNIYYAHTGWLRKRGIPGYGGWFTTKELSGGGPLIDIGVHLLDIAWWLCGCPQPVSVMGVTYAEFGPRGKGVGGWGTSTPEGTFNVEDLAVGLIRFANGLTINLEVSWAINNERERQWCQLFGNEGGCEWGENTVLNHEVNNIPTISKPDLPKRDPWQGEMQHFANAILNNTTPDPDATQGVTMMKMLDAIYKSAETKREVVIK
ncbi:MAG: Gfo/Idh/MocA family oxidoreductase [Abitibacteriaceae bacterium]|nr:Gfo/Idh/MocA family oxidoreductase [Abditibacteriaceae bacterium]MBV9868204.1 Gfo/Idh/MocA family oxidoreductase [Abditibacteriaceae bacterium]